jgi:hypothetical protein
MRRPFAVTNDVQGESFEFTPEIRQIVIPAKAGIQSFQDLLDSRACPGH